MRRALPYLVALAFSVALSAQQTLGNGWPTYGGDPGGTRYSTSVQIRRDNIAKLHPAWTFHTHALERYHPDQNPRPDAPSFESTPVLSGNTLYVSSPYDVIFALDARNGTERWHYDPKVVKLTPGGILTSRGVALWPLGPQSTPQITACVQRVFIGTLDARLIAVDAATGTPCADFGINGSLDLRQGVEFQNLGYFGVTSAPTIVGDVVIVGSYIGDNQQVDVESGLVRGFDVHTGKQLWKWEPLPWARTQHIRTGAGNTWSTISADPDLGLVYLPTSSPSPDYFGGMRQGDDRDADSVVALNAATGQKAWAFQTTHHDVWDYDIPSEPVLFTWRHIPAVAVTTKMGLIFLLDRRNGRPLIPVEERPVPQGGVADEHLSPTQPFQNIPALSPLSIADLNDLRSQSYDRSPDDLAICRKQFSALRYEGIYTPPTLKGSLIFPGNVGGVNWGGAAIDPTTGILYANTNRDAFEARLVPRNGREHIRDTFNTYFFSKFDWLLALVSLYALASLLRRSLRPHKEIWIFFLAFLGVFGTVWLQERLLRHDIQTVRPPVLAHFGYELSDQRKTPYRIERHPVVDSHGYSCTPAPWGGITAVNLNTFTKLWEQPLGSLIQGKKTGLLNFGGPIVTAAGLVFTAASDDPYLRVYDAKSGELLRELSLPAPGVATPMTYTLDGRQYLVIAAGGHGDGYSRLGDSLVAFTIN
jgi:quinoprotein glucose dehydrogenase